MDPYDPNFRQVGKRSHGRLLLGANSRAQEVKQTMTAASIPSKFETILYTGATEVDGFGNRVSRFTPQLVDLPGPGAYHKTPNAESASTSFSKKGYGNGFVSKTNRWYMAGTGGVPVHFPGPGSYDRSDYLQEAKKSEFSEAKCSGVFRGEGTGENSSIKPIKDALPGPGEYNSHIKHSHPRRSRPYRYPENHSQSIRKSYSAPGMGKNGVKNKYGDNKNITQLADPAQNASFGSRATRLKKSKEELDPSIVSPAPGAYDPNVSASKATPFNDPKLPSAAFASGSDRIKGHTQAQIDMPGPGHYIMHEAEELDKAEVDADGWRQFKQGQLDKFGNPINRRVPVDNFPGPGHYNPERPDFKIPGSKKDPAFREGGYPGGGGGVRGGVLLYGNTVPGPEGYSTATKKRALEYGRYLTKSAASISASIQRDMVSTSSIRPPGPAYYNPDKLAVTEKRSFHLNLQKRFMGV